MSGGGAFGRGQRVWVPINFQGADVFDEVDTMDVGLWLPDRVLSVVEARVLLSFREFFAPAQAADAVADQTSNSGGGSTSGSESTPSGGGTTSQGANGSFTTGPATAGHSHRIFTYVSTDAGGTTKRFQPGDGSTTRAWMPTNNTQNMDTSIEPAEGHGHDMAQYNIHTHDVDAHTHPAHSHTTPDHDHTIPGHGHDLVYGVFKEAMPASHSAALTVYRRAGSGWDQLRAFGGLTGDDEEIDLTGVINEAGVYRLSLQSEPGQPNGGRLGCDLVGYALATTTSV